MKRNWSTPSRTPPKEALPATRPNTPFTPRNNHYPGTTPGNRGRSSRGGRGSRGRGAWGGGGGGPRTPSNRGTPQRAKAEESESEEEGISIFSSAPKVSLLSEVAPAVSSQSQAPSGGVTETIQRDVVTASNLEPVPKTPTKIPEIVPKNVVTPSKPDKIIEETPKMVVTPIKQDTIPKSVTPLKPLEQKQSMIKEESIKMFNDKSNALPKEPTLEKQLSEQSSDQDNEEEDQDDQDEEEEKEGQEGQVNRDGQDDEEDEDDEDDQEDEEDNEDEGNGEGGPVFEDEESDNQNTEVPWKDNDSAESQEDNPPAPIKDKKPLPKDAAKEEEEEYQNLLSELPFEERANIRKYDDSYTVYKNDASFLEKEVKRLREINKQRKRTASMPAEISAKFPVSRKVVVLQPKKKVTRDPRFDGLSGDYHEDLFKKSYQFLYEMQEDEMATLKTQIAKEKNLEQKEKLQRGLKIMEDRKRAEKLKERRRNIIKEHRKEEMAKVAMGKTPHYLNKSEVKDLELKARFKELQDRGQLDNYLKKKRKRIESKERKKLPFGNPRKPS